MGQQVNIKWIFVNITKVVGLLYIFLFVCSAHSELVCGAVTTLNCDAHSALIYGDHNKLFVGVQSAIDSATNRVLVCGLTVQCTILCDSQCTSLCTSK